MQNSRNKTTSTNVSDSKGTPTKTTNSDDVTRSSNTTNENDKYENCSRNTFSSDDDERRDGPGGE